VDWDDPNWSEPGWANPGGGCCDDTRLVSRRADTLVFQFQVYQPPPACSAPQNLTGWWVGFIAKYEYADQDNQAVASASTLTSFPNVVTFPNGAATGLVQVSIGPLNTITLGDGPTRLVYACKVIDPSGNVTTVREGQWVVLPSPMRATTPF
jgi:hypothetical protein